uniref:Insulin-degrading enzyme n=1 Tax=Trichobilharzia regenti TaxID=157069 RepID=A0AA85K6G4_TRIRE|nr:unnamed protein product [Trichobilharzia regenti]
MDSSHPMNPITPVIRKSENDPRSYKVMLLRNRMKVLLISDPNTDKSAACLSVNIGSLSDPKELPGLAHFCEHMLFLGTEMYPIENTYMKYVAEHGGQSNASTKADETAYVFNIAPEYLKEALDIFSQFFISPLFTESATEREVNAVQSEFENNISTDTRRLFQLERTLSKTGHDYAKFFSGNRYSLFQSSSAQSVNTREQLLKFHSTWYSANIMGLVVLGKESLDDLEKLVEKKFSEVVDRNVTPQSWNETPWPETCLKKKVFVVPVNDVHQMYIMWPIPDYIPKYKAQAPSYAVHLLGNESRGSLLSLFKKLGWASRLSCGISRPGAGISSLIISIDLTLEGLEKTDEIITNIYQFISMLRADEPKKWIFDEEQAIAELNFRFKDKEPPYQYVSELAGNLLRYEMQDVLSGPYLASVYDPELIKEVLNCLTPDNSRVFIVSTTFSDICVSEEPWYLTKYLCTDIPEETLSKWRNCSMNPDLAFPEPNRFIATEFSLVPRGAPPYPEVPELLIDTAMTRIWYFPDNEFNLPKCYMTFHLASTLVFQDPLNTLLSSLYVKLFEDHINELSYSCMLAGMSVDMKRTSEGIKLLFSGYTHKMKSLVDEVLKELVNYHEPKKERFECLREDLCREIGNFKMKTPYQQTGVYVTNIVSDRSWINDDFVITFKDVTYEALVDYIKRFYQRIFIDGLIYGNISEEDAIIYQENLRDLLTQKMGAKPLLPSQITTPREVMIPEDSSYRYQRYISGQPASAIYYYLQCGEQSTRSDTLLSLFCQIVGEPIFNILRTEKQLGYIVHSAARRSNKLQGFRVLVQSPHHPNILDQSIEEFLLAVNNMLESMSDKEFDVHVQSLLTHLQEKPKGMLEQFSRLWYEVSCRHYNFKRYFHEAELLKSLTKEDVIKFFRSYIDPSSVTRRKLTVQVVSGDKYDVDMESHNHDPKVIDLKSHSELKRSCPLSGLSAPFMTLKPKISGDVLESY